MGADTKIQWCHHTFNPWRGCTKVSAGCAFCYADAMSVRNPKVLGVWGPNGHRAIAAESYWMQPAAWNRQASAAGERRRVFCASLADVFESADTMPAAAVNSVRAARLRLFRTIVATPSLDWLLLTKRPENILPSIEQAALDCSRSDATCEMLNAWFRGTAPENVWLGTSVEHQDAARDRIPFLLHAPATLRFLSCEPLLGPLDLSKFKGLDWVIVGGESGAKARACYVNWIDDVREQCQTAGICCFIKQLGNTVRCVDDEAGDIPIRLKDHKGGEPSEWPPELQVRQIPRGAA
jgi:protein gp37